LAGGQAGSSATNVWAVLAWGRENMTVGPIPSTEPSGSGIEAAVKLYVRLGNMSALTQQKLHRLKLIARYKDTDTWSFKLLREQCERDVLAIDAGIRELLAQEPARGYVDVCSPERISGWAQFIRYPEIPVKLTIYFDQKPVGQILANLYRHDLEQAKLGNGRHAFEFIPEKELFVSAAIVEVRAPNGTIIGANGASAPLAGRG
jgi:hypothetical protein